MPATSLFQTYTYLMRRVKKCPIWPSVVIFAITAGLVTYYLHDHHNHVEGMANNVEFIASDVGRRLLKSDAYGFARSLRPRESLARTGVLPEQALEVYSSGILDFTKTEKAKVTEFLSGVQMLSDLDWKFVKMKSELDWGYPYTFSDIVVLPQHLIDDVVSSRRTADLASTLLHEYLHICQRREQKRFNTYYERNYYMKHTPELGIPKVVDDTLVTNPDGLDIRWVFTTPADESGAVNETLKGDWFFCMQLDTDLQIQKSAYRVSDSRVSDRERLPLQLFARFFAGLANCYHPNEIFSYLQTNKILYGST